MRIVDMSAYVEGRESGTGEIRFVLLTCARCGKPLRQVEVDDCASRAMGPHRHVRCFSKDCFALMPASWAMCLTERVPS